MCVDECCRFCSSNLRIKGTIAHSRTIFDSKSQDENICNLLSKFGLNLIRTPLRSSRMCMKCFRILVRLRNDMDILNTWKDQETSDTGASASANAVEKRDREPTPSKTPRERKKSRKSTETSTLPSRTSVTEVGKTTLFLYHGSLKVFSRYVFPLQFSDKPKK